MGTPNSSDSESDLETDGEKMAFHVPSCDGACDSLVIKGPNFSCERKYSSATKDLDMKAIKKYKKSADMQKERMKIDVLHAETNCA